MFGYNTDQSMVNNVAVQAVQSVRHAFHLVDIYATWLANQPVVNGVDPLVSVYGFNADEAYVLRSYFETMEQVRTNNEATFDLGRKITGLTT